MGELKKWLDQKWVRINTEGDIVGECGSSENKKNPDRCLPKAKAQSLSQAERATTARKKKKAGAKGKTVVANTPKAKVRTAKEGGMIRENHKGCGAVMGGRRKKTLYVRGTKSG